MKRRASCRDERGAALVEFALVLPVLLMLVMGGISAANLYNHKLNIVNAAREGARYGATVPELQCSPVSNCSGKTWAQLVQAVTVARSVNSLVSGNVCVALVNGSIGAPVTVAHTTKSDGTACFNDGNGDPAKRVQVSVTRPGDRLSAVLLSIPVTQNGQAVARFEE